MPACVHNYASKHRCRYIGMKRSHVRNFRVEMPGYGDLMHAVVSHSQSGNAGKLNLSNGPIAYSLDD